MTPEEAAVATADAVRDLTSRFMLDAATYVHGGSLGFEGMSFYTSGRGAVLGDVDAAAVADTFAFFHPENVKANWESGAGVMPREQAAREFMECGSRWADAHLPDELDAARLAELAQKVADNADGSGAPVFEGWRRLPAPTEPKAAAAFHMNALRELRFALHAREVRSQGIAPQDAVRHRQPHMFALFGWTDDALTGTEVAADWDRAEDATNQSMAKALSVLTSDELDEFVALANAANAATA